MIKPGVYPAAVTPFDEKGRIDLESVAKLLAWFEAAGCAGAVLAGTNGEGPSLSATEKRDLIEAAVPMRGKLDLILGIASTSLEEASWLCRRAADAGAKAVLVMAPYYFRDAPESGIEAWFSSVLDRSPLPVIVYNFPQRAGVVMSPELIGRLGLHPQMAGVKDSSGNAENLAGYRSAIKNREQVLFVGDENLLFDALEARWSGSISGVANVIPEPLSAVVRDYLEGPKESAAEKFAIVAPLIKSIRKNAQPGGHKAVLQRFGVIARKDVRLPLEPASDKVAERLAQEIRETTGLPQRVGSM